MPRPENKTAVLGLPWKCGLQQTTDFWLAAGGRLTGGRFFHLAEIVAVSAIFFWMAWIATPMLVAGGPRFFPVCLTLLTVIYVAYVSPVLIHRETLASRGIAPAADFFIRKDNLAEAGFLFGSCTLGGILVMLMGGYVLGYGPWFDFSSQTFFLRFFLYFPSAFFQDGLFFSFFLRRWQAVCQPTAVRTASWLRPEVVKRPLATAPLWVAIVANALAFSLFHLPNRPVMGLALILGMVWGRIFSRTPNMLAAALGHAMLGTVLHLCLKVSTKVGAAYAWNHKGFYAVLCPFMESLISGRFQW